MAISGSFYGAGSAGGVGASITLTRNSTGSVGAIVNTTAGANATVWTKTDANTANCTLAANHGIVTNDVVDVYWNGGVRHGAVATITVNEAVFEGGAGTDFPANSTAGVVVGKQASANVAFDGDDIALLFAQATKRSYLEFRDSGGTVIWGAEINAANEGFELHSKSPITNPLTGNAIAVVGISCGEATAGEVRIGVLYDS